MQLKNKFLTVGCMAVATLALVIGSACNEHEIEPFAKSLASGKKQSTSSGNARPVDILFVVDNSQSMGEEQTSLDVNFTNFLSALNKAGADYRLATVSTTWSGTATMPFVTNALIDSSAKDFLRGNGVSESDLNRIMSDCEEYFSGKTWIDVSDIKKDIQGNDEAANEKLNEKVRDLFRCEAILGINGDRTEKGLATMKSALSGARDNSVSIEKYQDYIKKNFKRPGSILAIVFVTDENDCSVRGGGFDVVKDQCELQRNITDSCTMTREDRVQTKKVTDINGETVTSSLLLSVGQMVPLADGSQKTLRELCLQGDAEAEAALQACLDDPENCNAASYIQCPVVKDEDGNEVKRCSNNLEPRSTYYDFVVDYVASSNERFYYSQNPTGFSELTSAEEHKALLEEMAKSDIIVASIINRDQGIRYNDTLPETWCGVGTQSYRYQLFAEMFDNDPIYAPICCKNEQFSSKIEGDVCSGDSEDNGTNGKFGPVLAAIGERIGKAVNTICADSLPVTCNPAECKSGSPSCPCLFGCNETTYMQGTSSQYNLCNEFQFIVGKQKSDGTEYEQLTVNSDYTINYESAYCKTRTGSPIQINMIKTDTSKDLVFEYPKQTSGK